MARCRTYRLGGTIPARSMRILRTSSHLGETVCEPISNVEVLCLAVVVDTVIAIVPDQEGLVAATGTIVNCPRICQHEHRVGRTVKLQQRANDLARTIAEIETVDNRARMVWQ